MKPERNLIPLCLLCAALLPAVLQAQDYICTTNNGAITITGYKGSGGAVNIPGTINGYPVTTIGFTAFADQWNLISVTIPDSVTSIGGSAFYYCYKLTDVTIGGGVTNIANGAFADCSSLNSITIPDSVVTIGGDAFAGCNALKNAKIGNGVTSIGSGAFRSTFLGKCGSLTNVTIPSSVTHIERGVFGDCTSLTAITVDANNSFYSSTNGVLFDKSQATLVEYPSGLLGSGYIVPDSVTNISDEAFSGCASLTSVYFRGNAPSLGGPGVFDYDENLTVYRLPGTTGWDTTFGGRPTALWMLPDPAILDFEPDFGVQTNCFGFSISWATNLPVVVEACTNLANPVWCPVATNTLTGGLSYFSDPQWTNYPGRFYRLRSP